jgi:hypothetical protein
LSPLEEPEPVAPTQPAQQEPNPTPAVDATRAPLQTSSPTSSDDGIDRAAIIIIGAAVFFALLAAFAYILSAMLASNRASAAAANGPSVREIREDWQRPLDPPPPSPPPPAQTRDESLFQRRDGEDD